LASFAPSTLAPVLPVMEDIIVGCDGVAGDFCAEQTMYAFRRNVSLVGRFVSVDVGADGLRGGFSLFPLLHNGQESFRIVDAKKGLCLVNGIVDCTSKNLRVLKGHRLQGVWAARTVNGRLFTFRGPCRPGQPLTFPLPQGKSHCKSHC
jgi:hypothetical protein